MCVCINKKYNIKIKSKMQYVNNKKKPTVYHVKYYRSDDFKNAARDITLTNGYYYITYRYG